MWRGCKHKQRDNCPALAWPLAAWSTVRVGSVPIAVRCGARCQPESMDQPWEFMLIRPTRLSLPATVSSTLTAMSTATWRQFFTYHIILLKLYCRGVLIVNFFNRYNKYTQIAARAVRQSLKENERVAAEKRGLTALRYQHWENGKGGEQVLFFSSRCYIMESADTRNRHLRCFSTRLLTRHSALPQARCSPTIETIISSIPVTRREPDT